MDGFQSAATRAILSDEQVRDYRRDGAVLVRGVLDAAWLDRLGRLVEELLPTGRSMDRYEADRGDCHERKPEDATILIDSASRSHESARALVFDSPFGQIAAEGMRSRSARLYEDLILYRRAGSATPTVWHQDSPMWPMTGDQMSSVWFSLDAMRPETGALRFVAGTHKGPAYVQYVPRARRELVEADRQAMPGGPMPAIEGHEQDFDILSFATEPGDIVLFSPKVIHATYGSVSDRPKRSFSVRYLGDDIRWLNKPYGGFHAWMKDIAIEDGDPLEHACFPQVWPKT